MVRVIEIEPPLGGELDRKIQRRKDIIGKIAVRSNQQNPIKSWDLASNDDFQLELFRFFRNKGFFYERRDREWSHRSRELRSVGIQYGTNIKWQTQLIASFYWSKPRLGPAVAKKVADLFEGEVYETIRKTPSELVFQLFLLDEALWESRTDLAAKKAYIRRLKSYEYFSLFSLVVRALSEGGATWGDPGLTTRILDQWPDYYRKHYDNNWRRLTKAGIDHIVVAFKKESKRYSRQEGQELTYANYFKNQTYMARMLRVRLTGAIKRRARTAL